ncbi:MAG: DUF2799 domain-containing protein [Parvularculaceae bacterium]|nr:DUF2799 domain-containing protein [Parvularculaceae bacterium]
MIRGRTALRCVLPASALIAAGCASSMSALDCADADWRALGEADGRAGELISAFEDRAKSCESHKVQPDPIAYQLGRVDGLAELCTPDGGFAAGAAGLEYKGVCPKPAEPAFLAKFHTGHQLFELTQARDTAVADLEKATKALDRHYYNLRVARNRVENPNLSPGDRELARQDVDYHQREISRIEYDLPTLNADIESARMALDAFQESLAEKSDKTGPN